MFVMCAKNVSRQRIQRKHTEGSSLNRSDGHISKIHILNVRKTSEGHLDYPPNSNVSYPEVIQVLQPFERVTQKNRNLRVLNNQLSGGCSQSTKSMGLDFEMT